MRHHSKTKKFGRQRGQRTALIAGLAISLIEHGRIKTTEAKAKALRPFVEKLITRAQSGTLFSHRLLLSRLQNNTKIVKQLLQDIGPAYKGRKGGYTRILKIPVRKGDAAKMAIIELV